MELYHSTVDVCATRNCHSGKTCYMLTDWFQVAWQLGTGRMLQPNDFDFDFYCSKCIHQRVQVRKETDDTLVTGLPEELQKEVASSWPQLDKIALDELVKDEVGIPLECDVSETHWMFDRRLGANEFADKLETVTVLA
ncbi:hypothetical protein CLF_101166 [Clonorchis sinensis]|uniref:Uncharacterized protein n=1 Tax=Clonorchis sinensis TaxID=79923 RepID=G7Y537_CLOSI|nr:hypothetical protein CLF_101166 [Clonorchis sinensis]